MTLYMIESFERADSRPRVGAFTVDEAVVRLASRADRLRDRGWVECGTCLGHGQMLDTLIRSRDPNRSAIFDQEPCPDCVDGLVPPDGMIEAAAEGLYERQASWIQLKEDPWPVVVKRVRDRVIDEATAVLVEAARWEKE